MCTDAYIQLCICAVEFNEPKRTWKTQKKKKFTNQTLMLSILIVNNVCFYLTFFIPSNEQKIIHKFTSTLIKINGVYPQFGSNCISYEINLYANNDFAPLWISMGTTHCITYSQCSQQNRLLVKHTKFVIYWIWSVCIYKKKKLVFYKQ